MTVIAPPSVHPTGPRTKTVEYACSTEGCGRVEKKTFPINSVPLNTYQCPGCMRFSLTISPYRYGENGPRKP